LTFFQNHTEARKAGKGTRRRKGRIVTNIAKKRERDMPNERKCSKAARG